LSIESAEGLACLSIALGAGEFPPKERPGSIDRAAADVGLGGRRMAISSDETAQAGTDGGAESHP